MTDGIIWSIAHNLLGRVTGPLRLRLVMQPLVAIWFAVKGGLKDAQYHRSPYLWVILTEPDARRSLIGEGWHSIGSVFILATVIDAVYQYLVFRWVYPLEAISVAVILALVPYLLVRGPVNRIASRRAGYEKIGKRSKWFLL